MYCRGSAVIPEADAGRYAVDGVLIVNGRTSPVVLTGEPHGTQRLQVS
jgi:hypothetical protein